MTAEYALRQSTAGLGVGLAAFSAATFGFGTTFARLGFDGGSNPLTLVVLRIVMFILVIGLTLLVLRRDVRLQPTAILASAWMAVTLGLVSLGYQGAVAYIPVNLAALVFYTYPILVAAIALLAGRDRLTVSKLLALVLAFGGLALALGPRFADLDWRGIALAALASLSMALTVTFGGVATRDRDPLVLAVYTNALMLVAMSLLAVATRSFVLPATGLGALGVAGSCLSYVVAYGCWYIAIGLVRPVRLATMFNIEPVVTLLVAWVVLGESLSVPQLAGAVLVLASITLASRTGRVTNPEAT